MNYEELIRLYFERSTALQWYWTVYVVVIGGLLAISSLRARRDLLTLCLITVLFSFFAYKNLDAIRDVTLQRNATLASIRQYHSPDAELPEKLRSLLEPTLVQTESDGTRNFHVASDLLTVAALWAMERRRIKAAQTAALPAA